MRMDMRFVVIFKMCKRERSGRWKSQIIYELCIYDSIRFGQLKKDLPGITNTMLTKRLRELEDDGLVNRNTVQ